MTLPDMNPFYLIPAGLVFVVVWAGVHEWRAIGNRRDRFIQRSESARKGWATRKSRTFIPPKL